MRCTFCRLNEATSELPNSRGGLDPVCDDCRVGLEGQAYDDYMADQEERAYEDYQAGAALASQDFARLLGRRE